MIASALLVVTLLWIPQGSATSGGKNPVTLLWTTTRRFLNFGSTFGSATYSPTPYDRIMGQPVFSVTTPWGSPYMNIEKLSDLEEVVQEPENAQASSGRSSPQSISEEQNEARTVVLYFLDPEDAVAVHGEMKQMEQMEQSDIRLTSLSLARALRQASNFGHGLPTGAPPDTLTGKFAVSEGAALRYKLVPPKRQLYYAARCKGRERVGLQSDNPAEDAQTVVLGNSAIEGINLMRRRDKRERKAPSKAKTAEQLANGHMEGYTGIPVFYCPHMHKQRPFVKQLITGQKQEIPLFFNYEDLEYAWYELRERSPKQAIPTGPEDVEVFNLWDILTSMDKDAAQQATSWKDNLIKPFRRRFGKSNPVDIHDITFIPNSRSVQYKERISACGNGKARLRPMR